MDEIEITVLSSRVLDALSMRGLKEKTIREFERYGIRRIVSHCLGNGWAVYSKEAVQDFVQQERARMESGELPHYQWSTTRRAAVYLGQMAEFGKIQDAPLQKWEAEHNPLFQATIHSRDNSTRIVDIICQTRDAVMLLDLSDKTKANYIYCGFGAVLHFFVSHGEEDYSPEVLELFVKTAREDFLSGTIQRATFQNMRKAACWISEYLSTGQASQGKLTKYDFVYASSEFEDLIREFQMYMDDENYLKEGTRKLYISSVRTFFRTMNALGIYRYAEITLLDVTRCLAKISETFPLGIFSLPSRYCNKRAVPAARGTRIPLIRCRADHRTRALAGDSGQCNRVQRSCPLPRRGKLRSLRLRLTAKTAYRFVAPPLRIANATLVCDSVVERRRDHVPHAAFVLTLSSIQQRQSDAS